MLLCCWVAAVGAGLVKSEEILEGVARLRISNDIEFEEQTFMAIMSEAKEVCLSFHIILFPGIEKSFGYPFFVPFFPFNLCSDTKIVLCNIHNRFSYSTL